MSVGNGRNFFYGKIKLLNTFIFKIKSKGRILIREPFPLSSSKIFPENLALSPLISLAMECLCSAYIEKSSMGSPMTIFIPFTKLCPIFQIITFCKFFCKTK
jgi:hypothetical protein